MNKILAMMALVLASSCKKNPSDQLSLHEVRISTATIAAIERQGRADDTQEREDHRELVSPADSGFTPSAAQGLDLRLVPEKTQLHSREGLRYKLELKNIGKKEIVFSEIEHSFLKTGSLYGRFKCHLVFPDGHQLVIRPTAGSIKKVEKEFELPNSRFLTAEQQEEAVRDLNEAAQRSNELLVYLQPGEILLSRKEAGSGPGFRSLPLDHIGPGHYTFYITYDDPIPPPPDEAAIELGISQGESRAQQLVIYERYKNDHLGSLRSNAISFEVVP